MERQECLESARALHRARQGDVWVDQGAARAIVRRAPGWTCPAKVESHPLWRIQEMSYPDVGSCRRYPVANSSSGSMCAIPLAAVMPNSAAWEEQRCFLGFAA